MTRPRVEIHNGRKLIRYFYDNRPMGPIYYDPPDEPTREAPTMTRACNCEKCSLQRLQYAADRLQEIADDHDLLIGDMIHEPRREKFRNQLVRRYYRRGLKPATVDDEVSRLAMDTPIDYETRRFAQLDARFFGAMPEPQRPGISDRVEFTAENPRITYDVMKRAVGLAHRSQTSFKEALNKLIGEIKEDEPEQHHLHRVHAMGHAPESVRRMVPSGSGGWVPAESARSAPSEPTWTRNVRH